MTCEIQKKSSAWCIFQNWSRQWENNLQFTHLNTSSYVHKKPISCYSKTVQNPSLSPRRHKQNKKLPKVHSEIKDTSTTRRKIVVVPTSLRLNITDGHAKKGIKTGLNTNRKIISKLKFSTASWIIMGLEMAGIKIYSGAREESDANGTTQWNNTEKLVSI